MTCLVPYLKGESLGSNKSTFGMSQDLGVLSRGRELSVTDTISMSFNFLPTQNTVFEGHRTNFCEKEARIRSSLKPG